MKKALFFLAALLTFGLAANAQVTTFPWLVNFDGGSMPSDFTFVDSDGDGNNWSYSSGSGVNTHSGTGCATSASWANQVVLYPDNWMITPAITLPEASNLVLSWWAVGQDPSYAAEYYSVYIATGNTVADFTATTAIYSGTATGTYMKHGAELSSYAGQTIYIAFRHYNVSDMFRLNIDDIRVGEPEFPMLTLSGPSMVAQNSQATYAAETDVSSLLWYVDDAQQTATGNTFTYTFTTGGQHVVRAEAINSVGVATQSVTTAVYDPNHTCSRGNTVLEHFTTAQCQYCPGGHERLGEAVQGLEDRVAWIAHHTGFGSDGMTIAASSQDIVQMYGGGTWAPAMMLDRNCDFFPDEDGAVGSVGYASEIAGLFNQALSIPSVVSLAIDAVSYNQNTRELSITLSGISAIDLSDGRLSLYITEDSIIAAQQSTNGQTITAYQHDHVLRAAVNGSWGEEVHLASGVAFNKTLTYTLPATWKADKCRAIAFVNRYGSTIADRQILNAVKTQYLTSPNLAIENVEATMTINTWPNPVVETAYIDAESTIHNYMVVNAMGQRVMSGDVNTDVLELDVRNLAAGVYFVTVSTDNGTATQRLSVVK